MSTNKSFLYILATALITGGVVAAPLVYENANLSEQNKQLVYEKSQQDQEISALKNTIEHPRFSSDKNFINTEVHTLNENEHIDLSSLKDSDKYMRVASRQGVSIYFDLSSLEIKYNNPPIYEIAGTYYHIKIGDQKATYTHTNLIRYDMETKTTWLWKSKTNEWKIMNVTGDSMAAKGNRSTANHFFETAFGTTFYK